MPATAVNTTGLARARYRPTRPYTPYTSLRLEVGRRAAPASGDKGNQGDPRGGRISPATLKLADNDTVSSQFHDGLLVRKRRGLGSDSPRTCSTSGMSDLRIPSDVHTGAGPLSRRKVGATTRSQANASSKPGSGTVEHGLEGGGGAGDEDPALAAAQRLAADQPLN